GELEVPAPDGAALARRAHRALPVDRADGATRVELLVVDQRIEIESDAGGFDANSDRIGHVGPRRAPRASCHDAHVANAEHAHVAGRVPQRAPGPAPPAALGGEYERHERAAVVEVDADPIPTLRLVGQVFARPFVVEPR